MKVADNVKRLIDRLRGLSPEERERRLILSMHDLLDGILDSLDRMPGVYNVLGRTMIWRVRRVLLTGELPNDDMAMRYSLDGIEREAAREAARIREESRKLPVERAMLGVITCDKCNEDALALGIDPDEYSRTSCGLTDDGIQVWCDRHSWNLAHYKVEVAGLPVNYESRPGERQRPEPPGAGRRGPIIVSMSGRRGEC